jgi:cellulose synthase/poly-beta-1,6-N-acetylglucosamine synthase-like glycosyltransferase
MLKTKAIPNPTSPKEQDWLTPASLLFGGIYLILTLLTGGLLIDWDSPLGAVFFVGFELLFVGIAYDLTEMLIAIIAAPLQTPRRRPLIAFPPVALLVTVCDDVHPELWGQLKQTYPNLDVFILDDSQDAAQRALVDQSGYRVLRRGICRAFKAGNLNHWLDQYGAAYKYFAVLDSDSSIGEDFILQMVEYAEHPQNHHIAVFQSKILPMHSRTKFAQVSGAIAPLRLYILERTANRTGLILSWGHNQLLRTECVLQVGGFNENVTAEDTSLSLMLSAKGYCTRLVDVVSYDIEPSNVFTYGRRTARWAGQTAEIFRLPWQGASSRLKLLLCFHLYAYLMHNIYFGLLLLTSWSFRASSLPLDDLIAILKSNVGYFWPWIVMLIILTSVWGLQIAMRIYLARQAGINFKDFIGHSFLSSAIACFVALPVNMALLRAALGSRLRFTPTNIGDRQPVTFIDIARRLWLPFLGGTIVAIGIALRNYYLLFSPNIAWLFLWLSAPLILWLFHRDQRVGLEEDHHEL